MTGLPNMEPVVVNVSGCVFHLKRATLKRLPLTCVENAIRTERVQDKVVMEELYFERHAECFTAVLWYYTNGELHMPASVCPGLFAKELQFWQIDPVRMSRCCYIKFVSFHEDQSLLKSFEEVEANKAFTDNGRHLPNTKWEMFRKKIWAILDDPSSCTAAKVYVGISAFFIVVSIFVLSASTHPSFQRELHISEWKDYFKEEPETYLKLETTLARRLSAKHAQNRCAVKRDTTDKPTKRTKVNLTKVNLTADKGGNNVNDPSNLRNCSWQREDGQMDADNDTHAELPGNLHTRLHFLDIMDYCLISFFSVEFVLRLIFCPGKLQFFRGFLNIIDFVALSSEGLIIILEYVFPKERYTNFSLLDIIECIQIARVFRLFRLIKNFIGFRVLVYSVKASFTNMMLMVFLLIVAALLFSTIVFYVDRDQFPSIPDAVWWAVVTMTTVGYGDMYPKNILGKIVGCACAVSGVFVLSVLIPVLVSHFLLFLGFARITGANKKHGLANMVRKEYEIREYKKGKIRATKSEP